MNRLNKEYFLFEIEGKNRYYVDISSSFTNSKENILRFKINNFYTLEDKNLMSMSIMTFTKWLLNKSIIILKYPNKDIMIKVIIDGWNKDYLYLRKI